MADFKTLYRVYLLNHTSEWKLSYPEWIKLKSTDIKRKMEKFLYHESIQNPS